MNHMQLMDRYLRLRQELSAAYQARPWESARIDRLAEEVVLTEKKISAVPSADASVRETAMVEPLNDAAETKILPCVASQPGLSSDARRLSPAFSRTYPAYGMKGRCDGRAPSEGSSSRCPGRICCSRLHDTIEAPRSDGNA